MSNAAKKMYVESPDSMASITAALARIAAVPAGKTLIDSISDADWKDGTAADWKIVVHSPSVKAADRIDMIDAKALTAV